MLVELPDDFDGTFDDILAFVLALPGQTESRPASANPEVAQRAGELLYELTKNDWARFRGAQTRGKKMTCRAVVQEHTPKGGWLEMPSAQLAPSAAPTQPDGLPLCTCGKPLPDTTAESGYWVPDGHGMGGQIFLCRTCAHLSGQKLP